MAIGNLTRCMEEECLLGQMEEDTKDNMLRIRNREKELFIGQMEGNI